MASTMSRRTLCKTILSFGLLTVIDPLNTLGAGSLLETEKPDEQADKPPNDNGEIVTHICGRNLPNGGITIVRRTGRVKNSS